MLFEAPGSRNYYLSFVKNVNKSKILGALQVSNSKQLTFRTFIKLNVEWCVCVCVD